MKTTRSRIRPVRSSQAVAMHLAVDRIMRKFRLEPGLLAGSVYRDLHANDAGLLALLMESGDWNVRRITRALHAPFSTVSSALDRLEERKLIVRRRRHGDRRVVYIELTPAGVRLAERLRATQIETCRDMLAVLPERKRDQLIRLVSHIAQT